MKLITTIMVSLFLTVPAFAAEEAPKDKGTVVNGMRLAKKKEAKPEAKPTAKKEEKKPVKK